MLPGSRTVTGVTVTRHQRRTGNEAAAQPTIRSETRKITIIGHTSPCKPLFRVDDVEGGSAPDARARELRTGVAVPFGWARGLRVPPVVAIRDWFRPIPPDSLSRKPT